MPSYLLGFYTARFLDATNSAVAAERAVHMVLTDPHLAEIVKAERKAQPIVQLNEVGEIEASEAIVRCAAARPSTTTRRYDARGLGCVCHERRPRLAEVRPQPQGDDAL